MASYTFASMNILGLIKDSVDSRKKLAVFLTFMVVAGLVLLVGRRFLPTERKFLFLIWNFFLASIPLLLSTLMLEMKRLNYSKSSIRVLGFFWLVFLPNAPYMLTDFIHLTVSRGSMVWVDLLTISWFAVTAFFMAIISLNDMSRLLAHRFNPVEIGIIIFTICCIAGFGIYVGRGLRFNSWDVMMNPLSLIREVFSIKVKHEYPMLMAGMGISFFMFVVYIGIGLVKKELRLAEPSSN